MTTYTAIPNGDIDPDSPITTTLMTLLRDNPIAITEGATGAPAIQEAAMDTDSVNQAAIKNASVGQGEVKTGSGSDSGTENNSGSNITLNDYSLFPMIYCESPTNWRMMGHGTAGTASQPRMRLHNDTGSNLDWEVERRYINA